MRERERLHEHVLPTKCTKEGTIFNLLVFIQLPNIGRILLQLGTVRVKAPTTTWTISLSTPRSSTSTVMRSRTNTKDFTSLYLDILWYIYKF